LEKWKYDRTIKIGKNGISKESVLVTILSFILFLSLFSYPEVYSDVFDFDEPKNISSTPGPSQTPQIATLGSNVYIVWTEQDDSGNSEIFFTRSDDDGVTFPFGINNLSNNPDFSLSQQITAAGENVYVVWQEISGVTDIFFTRSDNNGDSFNGGTPGFPGTPINLSNTPDFSDFPQISSVGNNVYVVWTEGTFGDEAILFSASHNDGDTFVVEKENLSSSSKIGIPQFPQIATAGDNVYVVWQDFNIVDFPPTLDVFFSKSNDEGLTFSDGLNLNELSVSSSNPQVAAAGDNVYVVWESSGDIGSEIFFSASHNKGNGFVVEKENLRSSSSTSFPQSTQIAVAGENVYVVWSEYDFESGFSDIFIRASNDGGLSFGDPINLSHNLSFSELPQIAAVDDNVFVVWQDDVSSIYDVFFASSTNAGGSFVTMTKILSTPDFSLQPQIAVGSAHVIWQETIDNDEIFYNRGIETPISLTFDASPYKLGDTATITLTGVPGPGQKSVTVSSSADRFGFPLDLIETSPGIYTGTITFNTDSSDPELGILEVKFGGSIHADFDGIDVTANIFPRTVLLLDEYTLSSFVQVIVEDQNSNKKPLIPEIITVDIKSDTDQTGIQLDLKETEEDSGIFENKNLIFMTGQDFFSLGDTVTIVQKETDAAFITGNTINIEVRSTSDSTGIPNFVLTRAGPDTDFFEGALEFTSGETFGNAIKVADGNIISIEYRDEIANGLIIPNPDSTVGAIESSIGDTVTVTYMGTSDTAKIVDSSGGAGRGGGGFIRPGLVLNVIAGIFGGGSSGSNHPSFGTSSFATITGGEEGFGGIISDNDVNTLEETKTFKVGEKAVLRFDFTAEGGIGNIEHIGLYTNIRDGQKKYDSDTYIYYNPLKSSQLTVHDPNGFFSEANFDLLQKDVTNFVLKFDLTFAKPMAKSDLILESWNTKKWSSINKIPNAIEVIPSGIVQEEQSEPVKTFLEDVTDDRIIPIWVKSNAKWWSDGTIDDDNFISGIEYLVNEGIISVSLTETTDISSISDVQPWIKNTAGWWADDMISNDEFITAIEWLISNNIIQVV